MISRLPEDFPAAAAPSFPADVQTSGEEPGSRQTPVTFPPSHLLPSIPLPGWRPSPLGSDAGAPRHPAFAALVAVHAAIDAAQRAIDQAPAAGLWGAEALAIWHGAAEHLASAQRDIEILQLRAAVAEEEPL